MQRYSPSIADGDDNIDWHAALLIIKLILNHLNNTLSTPNSPTLHFNHQTRQRPTPTNPPNPINPPPSNIPSHHHTHQTPKSHDPKNRNPPHHLIPPQDHNSTETTTMARSEVSTSFQRVIVRHAYRWPETTLVCWAIFMIISGLYLITNFAKMANQQSTLGLGTPW